MIDAIRTYDALEEKKARRGEEINYNNITERNILFFPARTLSLRTKRRSKERCLSDDDDDDDGRQKPQLVNQGHPRFFLSFFFHIYIFHRRVKEKKV